MEKTIANYPVKAVGAEEVLQDFYICSLSREFSMFIRKEVLTGKAKFGVSDDGKELFQIAMAKAFKRGDFRADYYRGHTLLLALGIASLEDMFAQLYADGDNDPFSGGRQMNNHHATRFVDEEGNWLPLRELYNLSSDVSTTAGQMARGLGLAFASKVYRESAHLGDTQFTHNGNEVCFCIIGDASTSEGAFWETVNAAGVVQAPLAIVVADDGYGISVPTRYQTTKESISTVLSGFQEEKPGDGIDIYKVKGWDYAALCNLFKRGIEKMRRTHTPAVYHIEELTQPQGHSTSGSHERYKSAERLQWEKDFDCNRQFKLWILANGLAEEEELAAIEKKAAQEVKEARARAWKRYFSPIEATRKDLESTLAAIVAETAQKETLTALHKEFKGLITPFQSEMFRIVRRALFALRNEDSPAIRKLKDYASSTDQRMKGRFSTHLYSETPKSALKVPVVAPQYSAHSAMVNGFEVLNIFFDKILDQNPNFYAFGEDVGKIGGVNQGLAGLQEKYGEKRVFDTGIREWTIVGQALGMAMRGLRPMAEIQYLDYLIYAYSPLSDDVATLRYRSNATQCAPLLIRTRGHRLEGIWHTGSPMSVLLGGLRGIYILTPRNMVQAAGMYNTMLRSDDPAILIECLNGYRLKEKLPDNIGDYTVPLGQPEVLREGEDITIVTYGSCVRIADAAADLLKKDGISVELIDVQTLMPFDLTGAVLKSLQKTNRIVFLDEDLPGGASAFMMQQVIDVRGGYRFLDSQPVCISSTAHRTPYGTDGDYWSKPNVEDVYEEVFRLMHEADPGR